MKGTLGDLATQKYFAPENEIFSRVPGEKCGERKRTFRGSEKNFPQGAGEKIFENSTIQGRGSPLGKFFCLATKIEVPPEATEKFALSWGISERGSRPRFCAGKRKKTPVLEKALRRGQIFLKSAVLGYGHFLALE